MSVDLKQLNERLGSHEVEKIGVVLELLRPFFTEVCDELRAVKALHENAAANADRLLKKNELAQRLRVSISTIDKLMTEGMPFEKIGNAVRFDYPDVREWLRIERKKERENRGLRMVA